MPMYDPSKYGSEFGSKLKKRQTPELAARQRRQLLVGTVGGFLVGSGCLIEAIDAIHTGKMVKMGPPNSLSITGYEAACIALFAMFICAFGFWQTLRNK